MVFIYLASQSPRRRQILREMGIRFRVIPSTYREEACQGLSPARLVVKHAVGKVRKAKAPEKGVPILGADTIVYCRRKIFGKPKTRQEAHQMIRALSGRTHFVYTGGALWDPERKKIFSGYAKTTVFFKKLSGRQIRSYLRRVNPLDKAGSYAAQERSRVVRILKGSYSNVVGLPKELVARLLSQCKVKYNDTSRKERKA